MTIHNIKGPKICCQFYNDFYKRRFWGHLLYKIKSKAVVHQTSFLNLWQGSFLSFYRIPHIYERLEEISYHYYKDFWDLSIEKVFG
jgi:hypothetical protein